MNYIVPPALRLKYVLAASGLINYEQVKEALGPRHNRQVNAVLAGRGRITEALADRLCEVFPRLNREWVMTGDISVMQGDIPDEEFKDSYVYKVCVRPYLK